MPWENVDKNEFMSGVIVRADASAPRRPNPIVSTAVDIGQGLASAGRAVADATSEAWTGDRRMTADYPEIRMDDIPLKAALPHAFARAFTQDPRGYINIMKDWLPGAQIKIDAKGNPLIDWQGKTYYANKPGASDADFQKLATDMLMFAPAALWMARAPGAIRAMGRGAAGTAITDALQQYGASALGSQQDVSYGQSAAAGMTAALAEPMQRLLSPVALSLWNRAGRSLGFGPNWRIADRQGLPTQLGVELANSAFSGTGMTAADLTAADWLRLDQIYARMGREQRAAIAQLSQQGGAPTVATPTPAPDQLLSQMRGALSQTPTGQGAIPKTLGQYTRNQQQLETEELARTNRAPDPRVAQEFQRFDTQQNNAITQQVDQLRSMAAGGSVGGDSSEAAGAAVQSAMKSAQQFDRAYGSALYENLPLARVNADPLLRLPNQITHLLRDQGFLVTQAGFRELHPGAAHAVDYLSDQFSRIANLPPSKRTLRLAHIDEMRKVVGRYERAAPSGSADQTALTAIRNKFDREVERTWDAALIDGDPEALSQLREARAVWREYKEMWEPDTGVDAAVARNIDKMTSQQLDNNQVINMVFGASETGFKGGSLQLLRQMRRLLGDGSDGWNALREAAANRLLLGPAGSSMRTAMRAPGEITLANATKGLLNSLDSALDVNSSALMRELFSADELAQFRRFRYELRQIQPGKTFGLTKTGASSTLRIWLERFGGFVGAIGGAAVAMPGAGAAIGQQAVQSVSRAVANRQQVAETMKALTGWQPPRVKPYPVWLGLTVTGTQKGYDAMEQRDRVEGGG